MADVFLCRTGAIDAVSKRALKRAGVVVVEADNPADCQFIRASSLVSGDDMLWAAMDALKRNFGSYEKGSKHREQFAFNIVGLIEAARSASVGPDGPEVTR